MKKTLFSVFVSLAVVAGISIGQAMAQGGALCRTRALLGPSGPDICVSVVLQDQDGNLSDSFLLNEEIWAVVSLENVGNSDIFTLKGFSARDLHLFLKFTLFGPDGKQERIVPIHRDVCPEPPPPRRNPCDQQGGQVDTVEVLPGPPDPWVWTTDPFNVLALYPLDRVGRYSVKVVMDMKTYSPGDLITCYGSTYAPVTAGNVWDLESNTVTFSIVSPDSDGDGVPDDVDDCPDVAGPVDQNGCLYADETVVTMRIIDLSRSGVCGYLPNGHGRITCEVDMENVEVKVFDREDPDFDTAYGLRPSRHLLDDIYEANIGLIGACSTDADGKCVIGDDHPGKFLVIAKYEDLGSGKTVYTGKFKNFGWDRSASGWHWDQDDEDEDGATPPSMITKHVRILKHIRSNGDVKFLGGFKTIVTGSQLDVYYPEYMVWEGEQELYPFVYTSDEDWEVDVCMYVPEGYRLVGILDDNEEVVSTSDCVHAFVAGESKVFLFEVEDVGSPEPDVSFSLTAKHKGKVKKLHKKIGGVRKWNENKLEEPTHKQIKKLEPRWRERAEKLLEKMEQKKSKKD